MPSFLGGATTAQHAIQDSEPSVAYKRLKETIFMNNLDFMTKSRLTKSAEYSPADVLAGTLGSSIATTEIVSCPLQFPLQTTSWSAEHAPILPYPTTFVKSPACCCFPEIMLTLFSGVAWPRVGTRQPSVSRQSLPSNGGPPSSIVRDMFSSRSQRYDGK